jgi:hypothetical protein
MNVANYLRTVVIAGAYCFIGGQAFATSCTGLPANTALPFSPSPGVTVSSSAALRTNASGHLGLAADISVKLTEIKAISLIFSTSNPTAQVNLAFYDGATLLRQHPYSLTLNQLTLVNEMTADVEHFMITDVQKTNDAYLTLICPL